MKENIAADPVIRWFANRSEEAVRQASPIARIVANISKEIVASEAAP